MSVTLTRGDMEAWRAVHAPGLHFVDHSPVGGGAAKVDGLADYVSAWCEQTPDLSSFRKRSFVAGDWMLSSLALRGTTPEGNRYEWDYASVARVDADGLLAEEHVFPIEQWDEARAVFDEWSADGASEGLMNRAVATSRGSPRRSRNATGTGSRRCTPGRSSTTTAVVA